MITYLDILRAGRTGVTIPVVLLDDLWGRIIAQASVDHGIPMSHLCGWILYDVATGRVPAEIPVKDGSFRITRIPNPAESSMGSQRTCGALIQGWLGPVYNKAVYKIYDLIYCPWRFDRESYLADVFNNIFDPLEEYCGLFSGKAFDRSLTPSARASWSVVADSINRALGRQWESGIDDHAEAIKMAQVQRGLKP